MTTHKQERAAFYREELTRRRPDSELIEDGDRKWYDPIIQAGVGMYLEDESPTKAVRDLIESEIRATDSNLQAQTNRRLRAFHKTGQWPLGVLDLARMPLAVDGRRIALECVTQDDLRMFADETEKRAHGQFEEEMVLADWAEVTAESIASTPGATCVGDVLDFGNTDATE